MAPVVRRVFAGLLVLGGLCGLQPFVAPDAAGGQSGLVIALDRVEDLNGACAASFEFHNNLGAGLDRFNVDLVLFDGEGAVARRLVLDLAPLDQGITRVGPLPLYAGPCADLSRAVVEDIPACRAADGGALDCYSALSVRSGTTIELAK